MARPNFFFCIVFAILIILGGVPIASAHYSPELGRWLERDPIGTPMNEAVRPSIIRVGQRHDKFNLTSGFDADPIRGLDKAITRGELTNLYRYGLANPVKFKDPWGLFAQNDPQPEDPDVPGWNWGGPDQDADWEDWLGEFDRQMTCCKCLVYSEGGNENPECMRALVHVMWNRQQHRWNEARRETSFCQQANSTAFEGGIRSRRYRNCRDCVPGLNPAERRALDEADKACRNVMGTTRRRPDRWSTILVRAWVHRSHPGALDARADKARELLEG